MGPTNLVLEVDGRKIEVSQCWSIRGTITWDDDPCNYIKFEVVNSDTYAAPDTYVSNCGRVYEDAAVRMAEVREDV